MSRRILALGNAVGAVGIGHHRERLVVLDKFIDQSFEALVVYVVVGGPVGDQKISFEAVGMGYGRPVDVALLVVIGKSHVTLLVDGIVQSLVADEGDGHGCAVELGISEDHVQAHLPATAPSPDPDPAGIDIGPVL